MNWQEWADNELADVQFIDNTIRESIQAEKEVLAITGRLCARIAELEAALGEIYEESAHIPAYLTGKETVAVQGAKQRIRDICNRVLNAA